METLLRTNKESRQLIGPRSRRCFAEEGDSSSLWVRYGVEIVRSVRQWLVVVRTGRKLVDAVALTSVDWVTPSEWFWTSSILQPRIDASSFTFKSFPHLLVADHWCSLLPFDIKAHRPPLARTITLAAGEMSVSTGARALAIAVLLKGVRVMALDSSPSSTSGSPVTVGCITLDSFDYSGAKQVDISQSPTASACGVSGVSAKRFTLVLFASSCLSERADKEQSTCAEDGYGYSYLYDGGGQATYCFCSNDAPATGSIVEGDATDGSCEPGDFWVYQTSSPYSFDGCYTSLDPRIPLSKTTVSSPDACFTKCGAKQFAAFIPEAEGYSCACSSTKPGTGPAEFCAQHEIYAYRQDSSSSTSTTESGGNGLVLQRDLRPRASTAKRRQIYQENKRKRGAAVAHCPVPLTACAIPGHAEGFECIDTTAELESCGGCTAGVFGDSNTTVAGVE